jgi:hypothetical protein
MTDLRSFDWSSWFRDGRLWIRGLVIVILLAAVVAGYFASPFVLVLPIAALGAVTLLTWPILGLFGLVLSALLLPVEIGTGTDVALNPATLLVPILLGIWVLEMMRRGELHLAPSATNRPLLLFVAASILSLVIGFGTWDPTVPRTDSFLLVQLAQLAIFIFAAGAFWLMGNWIHEEIWLRRLSFLFLALAGVLAIIHVLLPAEALAGSIATQALNRAPFWLLLSALAGGQLLFNRTLSGPWRVFLAAAVGACLIYAFYIERATISNWAGVAAVLGVLAWLRWPRLRWVVIVLLVVLAVSGVLFSSVYEFAGGTAEWVESGGSRLALIGRVIDVTMRNPITGLGPAAYRNYAKMKPLYYAGAYYLRPWVSSHNNYVDLFSHVGLVGLGLFFWFAVELARLGLRLRARFTEGFAAGYVNSILAAGAGALMLMLLADWILPFVYNIGFPGFQASVLVWLFLGGLVALEQMAK